MKHVRQQYAHAHRAQIAARGTAWQRANVGRYAEDQWRRQGISLTWAQFEAMRQEQGGACALCGKPPQDGRRLFVDHDHATGRVRGLLCSICNRQLANWGDDEAGIQKVLDYVRGSR